MIKIDEDTLVEMEERAAHWEFGDGLTRSQADAQTCKEYGVSIKEFYDAIQERDFGKTADNRAA